MMVRRKKPDRPDTKVLSGVCKKMAEFLLTPDDLKRPK